MTYCTAKRGQGQLARTMEQILRYWLVAAGNMSGLVEFGVKE
jgi:hypothetical protein